MKTALVQVDYQGLTVAFNEDGWLNATEIAAQHGKRVADWLENRETQNYITVLADVLEVPKKALLKVQRGGRGKTDATWLHPKLAVGFGRWLDVRFAVWCDLQIDSLIKRQHPHFDWKRLRHEASATFRVMNDILKEVRADQGKPTVPHHYMNEAKLVNWALAGEYKGLDRDALPLPDLNLLAKLELKNATLIGRGVAYPDRKKILESLALESRVVLFPGLAETAP